MSFLLSNQAQTFSKQEQTELRAQPSTGANLPHGLHHEGLDSSSWEAPKALLGHNLNVSFPLQAGVRHLPRGAGAFPGIAGCFHFPSWVERRSLRTCWHVILTSVANRSGLFYRNLYSPPACVRDRLLETVLE